MAERPGGIQRTRAIAERRERRRRRMGLTLTGVLILGLSAFALYAFVLRDLSVVEIRDLEINGLDTSSTEGRQVAAAIDVAAGEMTTLNIKQDVLDEELSRFPRIESATIEADFPNAATVTIQQRSDGSILGEAEDALLIATDGTVLGPAGAAAETLPLIGEGSPPEGARVEGEVLEQALVLGATPVELRQYVDHSEVSGDGVEVTLSNGLVLLFGDADKAAEKWKAAAVVIADPDLSDAGYVDLTVPRRPAAGSGNLPGAEQ